MKVLQINCVYKDGSTGKIVSEIHNSLRAHGIRSIVCYGRGVNRKETNTYKICSELYAKINKLFSKATGMMYGGCILSTAKLIRIIKKYSPDIVHLHSINGNFVNIYRLVSWLKNHKVRTVLTLHAEFMYTANCGHAFECQEWKNECKNCPRPRNVTKSFFFNRTHKSFLKMEKAFSGFEDYLTVVSVSPWLIKRAEDSLILGKMKHKVILNGIDTNIYFYKTDNEHLFNNKLSLNNRKIVFHVTAKFTDRYDHAKGGVYIIELAKRMKNVLFLVAGKYILKSPDSIPENIILLGNITDQLLLSKYYSIADVSLITSRRETFSMPCAESLCCGTPVVGFMSGGPESITIKEFSEFVAYGDIDNLEKTLEKWLSKENKKSEISDLARKKYNKELMVEKYVTEYKS